MKVSRVLLETQLPISRSARGPFCMYPAPQYREGGATFVGIKMVNQPVLVGRVALE